MARQVHVTSPDWSRVEGHHAVICVKVDWPELCWTEEEIMVNSIAAANGDVPPYPDRSVFEVVIGRPIPRWDNLTGEFFLPAEEDED